MRAILLISLLTFVLPAFSQNILWLNLRAQSKLNAGDYDEANELYHKALSADSTLYKSNIELGKLFLYEYELFDSSEFYIARGLRHSESKLDSSDFFHYARALQMQEKPTEAIVYYRLYEKYAASVKKNQELILLTELNIKTCENAANAIQKRDKIISVTNLGFETNSPEREYTTVITSDPNVIIYNGRYQDTDHEKLAGDSKYMENVYYFEKDQNTVSTYDQSVEQENHWAVVSAVPNSDSVLIFFQNALHFSSLTKQQLSNYKKLPDQIIDYYFQPHGSFSPQLDTFIFSAQKTSEDDLDLYITTFSNGKWSVPTPLDSSINSPYNEDSPFISADGKTLYFSSKNTAGFGGYDVYKTTLSEGVWSTPINLGYPINSAGDDIYFVLETNDKYGYISSNRTGGFGQMDLYSVAMVPRPTFECEIYQNTPLLVTFDLSESVDSNSVELEYKWYFEDGETYSGETIEKQFNTPGDYTVKIDILENASGLVEKSEIIKEFSLEEVNYIGFNHKRSSDTTYEVILNAGISWLEGMNFIAYNWKINDSIISLETPELLFDFKDSGKYIVHLQIDALDQNEDFMTFCTVDTVALNIKKTKDDLDYMADTLVVMDNGNKGDEHLDKTRIDELVDNNDSTDKGDKTTIDRLIDKNDGADKVNQEDASDGSTISNAEANSIISDLEGQNKEVTFGNIYFGFDQYSLTLEARGTLDSIASFLNENIDVTLLIFGHTDSKGSAEYNLILSKKRANAAVNYLIAKGIDPKRIVKTVYLGESEPEEPNEINGRDNPDGRRLNRRVTLVLAN